MFCLQPRRLHLRRVVGEADGGPVQRGLELALRQDLPHRQRVLDLLQHEAREHRQDLHVAAVAELVDVVEQARVLEREVLVLRAQPHRRIVVVGRRSCR